MVYGHRLEIFTYYVGQTSSDDLEKALRRTFGIETKKNFHLRFEDGSVFVLAPIDDCLEEVLQLEIDPEKAHGYSDCSFFVYGDKKCSAHSRFQIFNSTDPKSAYLFVLCQNHSRLVTLLITSAVSFEIRVSRETFWDVVAK